MYVHVYVTPKAKREYLEVVKSDSLRISVREPAAMNLANHKVRTLVAQHYQAPRSAVRIISGHQSPKKVLSVEKDALS